MTVGLFSKRLLLLKTSTLLTLPLGSTINRTMTFPVFNVAKTLRGITGCGCDKAFKGMSSSSSTGGGGALAMAGAAAARVGGVAGAATGGGACGVGSTAGAVVTKGFSASGAGAFATAGLAAGRAAGAGAGVGVGAAVTRGFSAATLIHLITLLAWRLARSIGSSTGADAAPTGATNWAWTTVLPATKKATANEPMGRAVKINRIL